MLGTLRQEAARTGERRDREHPQVIHRCGIRKPRSPRVAWCVARLPLASAAPVIPGASTRENVERPAAPRQCPILGACGRPWGLPGDTMECRCGSWGDSAGDKREDLPGQRR